MSRTVYPRTGPMYNPAHPGKIITNVYMKELGLSARQLAAALGVSHTSLTRILNGQGRVTSDMAVRLEAVLGRSAGSWLTMQSNYDLWQSRQHIDVTPLHQVYTSDRELVAT